MGLGKIIGINILIFAVLNFLFMILLAVAGGVGGVRTRGRVGCAERRPPIGGEDRVPHRRNALATAPERRGPGERGAA